MVVHRRRPTLFSCLDDEFLTIVRLHTAGVMATLQFVAAILSIIALGGFAQNSEATVDTVSAPFAGSGGIALNPATGELYVGNFGDTLNGGIDDWGREVKRIAADGQVSVMAQGFFVAAGNALAADGETLLQVDLGRGLVVKVHPNGSSEPWAKGLNRPVGVVATADGGAFATECGGNTIVRIAPDGSLTPFASDPAFNCPNGLTQGPDGALYTANFRDGKVFRIDVDGGVGQLAVTPGGGNGHLAYSHGRLIVADRAGHRILSVGLDGRVTLIAGSGQPGFKDGPAAIASFSHPNGVAVSPDGSTIYVNSQVNEDLSRLNPMVLRIIRLAAAEAPADLTDSMDGDRRP